MEIYIVTHGIYEEEHISLCTTDFNFAIQHLLDYSNIDSYKMGGIEIWGNSQKIFKYGHLTKDIINWKNSKEISYEDIKNDIVSQLKR